MLPRNWHHGHSLGAGALVGISIASYRVWVLLAFAFLVGCAATLLVMNAAKLAHWVQRRFAT